LPRAAIFAIASVANGWGPLSLVETQWHGLHLNALRGGPLDKQGVGSRILNARGAIDAKEVSRLQEFAIDRTLMDGDWPVLLRVMGKECASQSGGVCAVAHIESSIRFNLGQRCPSVAFRAPAGWADDVERRLA
jgi:hypothetical protein